MASKHKDQQKPGPHTVLMSNMIFWCLTCLVYWLFLWARSFVHVDRKSYANADEFVICFVLFFHIHFGLYHFYIIIPSFNVHCFHTHTNSCYILWNLLLVSVFFFLWGNESFKCNNKISSYFQSNKEWEHNFTRLLALLLSLLMVQMLRSCPFREPLLSLGEAILIPMRSPYPSIF